MSLEVSSTMEIEVGDEYDSYPMLIEIVAHFSTELEAHYGADADGNRGTSVTFITLDHFVCYSNAGLNITDWLRAKYPKQFEQIKGYAHTDMADKVAA